MKKFPQKTQAPRIESKKEKNVSKDLEASFSDTDIDEYFRFDDKLHGKRTYALFEAKSTHDGFYDIIHDSFGSSDGNLSSPAFEGFDISDIELNNHKLMQILEKDFTEISQDEDLTEDNESKRKSKKIEKSLEKPERNLEKAKNTQRSENFEKKREKIGRIETKLEKNEKVQKKPQKQIEKNTEKLVDKSVQKNKKVGSTFENNKKTNVEQVKSTSKKKSFIDCPSKYDYEDWEIQKIEEAKSKPKSQENIGKANQKVETNNKYVVKVNKKFQNKNEIKEKRREEKEKQIKKQINEMIPVEKKNETQKEKKDLSTVENKGPRNEHKMKKINKQIVEAWKVKQVNNIKKSQKKRMSIPKRDTSPNKKRIPSDLKDGEEDGIAPKFTVIVDVKKLNEKDDRIGQDGRYPRRLRIPLLRFWQNERRHYDRGMLSSITLVDDRQGQKIGALIESQI